MSERKTRWSKERAELTISAEAPAGLTQSQLHSYLLQIRLEEINKKLNYGDLRPSHYQRNPPEALKKQLEDERAKLIEEALKTNPEFMTPIDFVNHIKDNRDKNGSGGSGLDLSSMSATALNVLNAGGIKKIGNKWAEKIWIPQREFPDVNFIGLLIGPRGNTLKKMETESGAKISIRGKGSLKEGKNDPASLAAAEEELHCLIMADTAEKVSKASKLVNNIVETAASTPEAAEEMKRVQLRELAALNGTLREEETVVCANCGQSGHRRFECLERRSVTASTVCRICGGAGHLASDCVHKHDPEMLEASKKRSEKIESEYMSFMAELGEKRNTTYEGPIVSSAADAVQGFLQSVSDEQNPMDPQQQQQQQMMMQQFAQMDPAQLQQYYASMMQWNPAAYAAWAAQQPPPPPPQ